MNMACSVITFNVVSLYIVVGFSKQINLLFILYFTFIFTKSLIAPEVQFAPKQPVYFHEWVFNMEN